jgi:glycosyltransferase involved in cell wall biosynthesis
MSVQPEVSLVVNTYQKPAHLALVLESIARQEGVDGRFEVVVTDDGSIDSTASLVESFAARAPFRVAFTSSPHDGFRLARNRNAGARLATGRILLFLDGDCVIPRARCGRPRARHRAAHRAANRAGDTRGPAPPHDVARDRSPFHQAAARRGQLQRRAGGLRAGQRLR